MSKSNSLNNLTNKIGLSFFIGSLIFYFLLKLPFNLSVICSSANEGFYFIFGHYSHGSFPNSSGPLFVLIYSIFLKIFGFGTWSIIVFHFIQTIIAISIATIVYLIAQKILYSKFFSGLVVLFWILIQVTPIGLWGQKVECTSSFSLDAEYFCTIFSLGSIYCFLLSTETNPNKNFQNHLLSTLSGVLAVLSLISKASGTILTFSVICWFIYLLTVEKEVIQKLKYNFVYFFLGLFSALILCNIFIYLQHGELFLFWKNYYIVGIYSKEFSRSVPSLALSVWNFMTRYTSSLSNLILFFFAFLSFGWGLLRNYFLKPNKKAIHSFVVLLSIWAIGNVCTIIAPGEYGSYYYILIWPSVALLLAVGIQDLLHIFNKKIFKTLLISSISIFFIHRLLVVSPTYIELIKENISLNLIFQNESFQDPVKPSDSKYNLKRTNELKIADLLNNYLPNKNDRFYVFNFTKGHPSFGPNIYIYAKRLPPTIITADFLHYAKYINKVLGTLINDLTQKPPKILVVPKDIYGPSELSHELVPFFQWFSQFLKANYHQKLTFDYRVPDSEVIQTFLIFEKN